MPVLVNSDGSSPTLGQLWPTEGWAVLPPGLAGLQGVEVWPTVGGTAWFVEVGSPAWNALASQVETPRPRPRAGTSPIPARVPPVVLVPGTVTDEVPSAPSCSCEADSAGGRSLWWLVGAALFLWML
jgi:hypothetical protein